MPSTLNKIKEHCKLTAELVSELHVLQTTEWYIHSSTNIDNIRQAYFCLNFKGSPLTHHGVCSQMWDQQYISDQIYTGAIARLSRPLACRRKNQATSIRSQLNRILRYNRKEAMKYSVRDGQSIQRNVKLSWYKIFVQKHLVKYDTLQRQLKNCRIDSSPTSPLIKVAWRCTYSTTMLL